MKMIHRKILRVKTTGSREKANLRPILSDNIGPGVNMLVLEYDEAAEEAIVEIYGSDHSLIAADRQCNEAKLKSFYEGRADVLEVLTSHAKSPATICKIGMPLSQAISTGLAIDEAEKKIALKGKDHSYSRKETDDQFHEEIYVLDEG